MRALAVKTLSVLLLASPVAAEELDCLIQPKTTVQLSTPVEGVISEVLVDRGDVVERDQVLVRLESSVERASVQMARARVEETGELVQSRVQLEYAARTLERRDELNRRSVISEQDLDEARSQHELAKAGVRQAEEEMRLAELQLQRARASLGLRTIRSPINGVVTQRFYEPGEFADTRAILELAQVDPLEVEVFAPVSLLGRVQPGMTARVLPEEPFGGGYQATVSVIDPVIDAASGTFGVRLELPNSDLSIPAGLNCRLQFLQKVASEEPPAVPEGEASVSVEIAQTVAAGPARTRPFAEPGAACQTTDAVTSNDRCAAEAAEFQRATTERSLPQVAAPPPEPEAEPAIEPAIAIEPEPEPEPEAVQVAALEAAPAVPPDLEDGPVVRAVFTTAIERYEPVDAIEVMSNELNEARFFTEIRDMDGRTLVHRWEYRGRVQAEVPFQIRGPRWRVYSVKKLRPIWTGEWTVHVVDEEDNVLYSATLDYVAPVAQAQ